MKISGYWFEPLGGREALWCTWAVWFQSALQPDNKVKTHLPEFLYLIFDLIYEWKKHMSKRVGYEDMSMFRWIEIPAIHKVKLLVASMYLHLILLHWCDTGPYLMISPLTPPADCLTSDLPESSFTKNQFSYQTKFLISVLTLRPADSALCSTFMIIITDAQRSEVRTSWQLSNEFFCCY